MTSLTHSTRMPVDAERHITVDWTVSEYHMSEATWFVSGRCRMWQSTRLASGISLAARALTEPVEIVTRGLTIQCALIELMRAAWTQCLEGRTQEDTEH